MNILQIKKVMKKYGKSWERQDSNLILECFTKKGIYQESPIAKPYVGHVQIKKFWDEVVVKNTKNIKVMPRVGITDLKIIERGTTLLVMLCNLGGGQIPGKIYQYAATKKYVLFILDGTEEEKAIIYNYFSKFNRFVFCDNNIKDISNALKKIYNKKVSVDNSPVDYFSPKNIFKEIVRDLYAN